LARPSASRSWRRASMPSPSAVVAAVRGRTPDPSDGTLRVAPFVVTSDIVDQIPSGRILGCRARRRKHVMPLDDHTRSRRRHYGRTEQKIGAIQQIRHGGPSDQQTGDSAAQFLPGAQDPLRGQR
jgi:hypothetical protein